MTCACGCGQAVTVRRGGYQRHVQASLWFATIPCQARFETAAIRMFGEGKLLGPVEGRLKVIQGAIR